MPMPKPRRSAEESNSWKTRCAIFGKAREKVKARSPRGRAKARVYVAECPTCQRPLWGRRGRPPRATRFVFRTTWHAVARRRSQGKHARGGSMCAASRGVSRLTPSSGRTVDYMVNRVSPWDRHLRRFRHIVLLRVCVLRPVLLQVTHSRTSGTSTSS